MIRGRRTRAFLVAAVLSALTACSGLGRAATPSGSDDTATSAAADDPAPAVSGITRPRSAGALPLVKAGQGSKGSAGDGWDIPPIPEIVVPDVSVADATTKKLSDQLGPVVNPVKGVSVVGARCTGDTVITPAGVNYGDGSGVINRGGTSSTNYGDGSGTFTRGSITIVNYGDGSGRYTDGKLTIANYGDGSGTYSDGTVSISIYGDGSGAYSDGKVTISNYGDGSGAYSDGTTEIANYGDGSGRYTDGTTSIANYGDGTGQVDGRKVAVSALTQVPPIGKLPPMKALTPLGTECGTLIRLQDRVLFDFDSATLRPEAGPVLDAIASALKANKVPLRVNGHTDSLGGDQYNLDLSLRRAKAVVAALAARGLATPMKAAGLGETQPIAQNSIGGKDNPGGRQLNRRVEIIIPTG
jgi:OOP family OmpA-OmpF porin